MKAITRDGLSADRSTASPRPVPRVKRSLATSFCAGASASWAEPRRGDAPYRFGEGCFCLSPEQHGAQFREDGWELVSGKGRC